MIKQSYYIVNGITIYRLIAAPVLIILIFTGNVELFKWMLPVSFFTDFIDGYLARKFNVISVLGSKLDSIGDDLTVAAGIIGVLVLKPLFIHEEIVLLSTLLVLYLFATILALTKYHKLTGFHTYIAKCAAILQGLFLILVFIFPEPIYFLFYAACVATIIDLVEEIFLIFLLPKWEADVRGVYWVMKRKHRRRTG